MRILEILNKLVGPQTIRLIKMSGLKIKLSFGPEGTEGD
jgi:hypothetical protein